MLLHHRHRTNIYLRKEGRFDVAFYVHDTGATGDHFVKHIDLAALGAQGEDIRVALAVDGAFVYSDSNVFLCGSDKANKVKQLGFGLYIFQCPSGDSSER
jgi:hypothetical protein